MSNQWFRMYSEFAHDPKVQMLSEAMQRRFIMLLCARCNDSETLQDHEVTFLLRITEEEWLETKRVFLAKKFIDDNNNILNWEKRQYRSDSSSERVKRHREAKKQLHETECNVSVTPQNRTEQNRTDTEKKVSKQATGSRFALADLPDEWREFCLQKRPDLNPDELFSEFKDFWAGVPGQRGRKLDWLATWRNRVREKKHLLNGSDPPKTWQDRADERHNQAVEEARKIYEQRTSRI